MCPLLLSFFVYSPYQYVVRRKKGSFHCSLCFFPDNFLNFRISCSCLIGVCICVSVFVWKIAEARTYGARRGFQFIKNAIFGESRQCRDSNHIALLGSLQTYWFHYCGLPIIQPLAFVFSRPIFPDQQGVGLFFLSYLYEQHIHTVLLICSPRFDCDSVPTRFRISCGMWNTRLLPG